MLRVKFDLRSRAKYVERLSRALLFAITLVPLTVTFLVVLTLAYQSFDFFSQVNVFQFLTELEWEPLIEPRRFGVVPLVLGSLQILVLSLVFALPVALLTAIYLAEFASSRTRNILKPALEILAGIPTVVFGFFALTALTPL